MKEEEKKYLLWGDDGLKKEFLQILIEEHFEEVF